MAAKKKTPAPAAPAALTVAHYDALTGATEGHADPKPRAADALRARRKAIHEGRLVCTPRDEAAPVLAEPEAAAPAEPPAA